MAAEGKGLAAEEPPAGVSPALGRALDQPPAAARANGGDFGGFAGKVALRARWAVVLVPLHAVDQSEQALAVHEPDRLPRGEPPSFLGEVARADDDGLMRALGREDTVDLPHHPDANAAAAPVLALHEVKFAAPAKADVDAAVRPRLVVLVDAVVMAVEGVGHE